VQSRAAVENPGNSHRLFFEARTAQHRPSLVGAERHCGVSAAFGADGAGFRAGTRGAGCSLGLALFAVLGVIDKLFGVEEPLLVGGKDELFSANNTLQDPI